MEPVSDDALMVGVAAGDEEAFRLLVERWERRLVAFLFRTLGSVDEAEDLAQETFLRLYRHAADYSPRGRFTSYLFRIAGNLARNEIRRRSLRQFLSLDWFRSGEDPGAALGELPGPVAERPDERFEAGRQAERVRRAILSLPDRQRMALVLQRFEDLSQAEIAEAMGISESAVEALLVRAMRKLRRRLGDPGA